MLDLFGSEYVIDHIIAEHNLRIDEKVYRSYTADLLKVIAESIGASVSCRYDELIDRPKEEEKTGDEIALEVIKRAGLKVTDNDTI